MRKDASPAARTGFLPLNPRRCGHFQTTWSLEAVSRPREAVSSAASCPPTPCGTRSSHTCVSLRRADSAEASAPRSRWRREASDASPLRSGQKCRSVCRRSPGRSSSAYHLGKVRTSLHGVGIKLVSDSEMSPDWKCCSTPACCFLLSQQVTTSDCHCTTAYTQLLNELTLSFYQNQKMLDLFELPLFFYWI